MKALILAGGHPQIALINKLKDRGIYTILADWNTEQVAKKYADKFYQISTLDVDAVRTVAIEEQVDFLITVCTDQALTTVAKISEELHLPCYLDYHTALHVTNKQYMKEVFVRHGIPTAKHIIMEKLDMDKIGGFMFPLITKPVDCNSSKGVVKVEDAAALAKAFDAAKGYSRTHTAIIEEYIEGAELSVDVYVDNGKAYVLDITNSEKIKDDSKFVIHRTWHPANISAATQAEVGVVAQQIAAAFGIQNAPMLIQMIERDGHVYVLEFSARTGGGVKFLSIKEQCGFDVIDAVIDLTLGHKPALQLHAPPHKYMIDEYIYCKPGVFDRLQGFETQKQEKTITAYYVFKEPGATFDTITNSGDRIAGFTIVADDLEELKRKHTRANQCLQVLDVNGNDMMRHDLLTEI